MYVVHHNTLSDSFRIRIAEMSTDQDRIGLDQD